jgi:hypothetical protein
MVLLTSELKMEPREMMKRKIQTMVLGLLADIPKTPQANKSL